MTSEENETIPNNNMPTFKIAEWVKNHSSASTHSEAHPIDEDLISDNMSDLLQHSNLSVIQAVLSTTDILQKFEEKDNITKIEETDSHIYYQVDSAAFYSIFAKASELYNARIEIEQGERIVDLHTMQFLYDLYNYTGDFGGQTGRDNDETFNETLCNALNDPKPSEGCINQENEPENAHYAYIDSRGLVFEKGTHPR